MQFIDLKESHRRIQLDLSQRVQKIFDHTQFIMGPEVFELEKRMADYVGVRHCITMSSGTTALQIALMALDIKPGDRVITTPFSFFATAGTILALGAIPDFVDIDPHTFHMNLSELEAAITEKTKAIMPVSLFGDCPDFDAINAIASRYHLPVIEDGAQSFGALYHGRRSCGLSTIGCTSFFPSKPLGCYGDGGACFTNDDYLAEQMRLICNHGQTERYHHVRLGMNARFDTLQAAVLLSKLEIFDEELAKRQEVADWYRKRLLGRVEVPAMPAYGVSAYAQYTIQTDQRDRVAACLKEKGIPTAIHYPSPLHHQPVLQPTHGDLRFPHAERAAKRVLSLPFHPYLTEESVDYICNAVLEATAVGAQSVEAADLVATMA